MTVCYRLTLALFPVFLFLAGCGRKAPDRSKMETGPIEVRVAPVVMRQMQRVVESVGTLYPYEEVIISAEIEGRVNEVSVDLGDEVKAGQVLAKVDEEEQKYLLAQNEAQLRQSLERLGLKDEKDKVKDIRETPEVRRAQADLFDADQRYSRMRTLVDQGVGSKQDLDAAQARYKAMAAAYDSTLYQTRNLIQEVERFKAIVELQRKRVRDTTVRAPFNAAVKDRQVTVGQYVRANTPLFTLVKTDPIRLRIEIPERMAPWVAVNQSAEVTLEAFENRKFQGKIWRISPTVDQSKRTFLAEALIANPAGELKAGSYAKARVATNKYEQMMLVPASAINYVFGSNKAYVIENGVVRAREVRLGDRFAGDVEILDGLKTGEQVATTQVAKLDTGTRVRVSGAEQPAAGN